MHARVRHYFAVFCLMPICKQSIEGPVKCDGTWNLGGWACWIVASIYMARKVNSKRLMADMNVSHLFKMQIVKIIVFLPDDGSGH